jgi:hypothetical protein
MVYVFDMHNLQNKNIHGLPKWNTWIIFIDTSFIYGLQNNPMVDIIIVRDSILVKQFILKTWF